MAYSENVIIAGAGSNRMRLKAYYSSKSIQASEQLAAISARFENDPFHALSYGGDRLFIAAADLRVAKLMIFNLEHWTGGQEILNIMTDCMRNKARNVPASTSAASNQLDLHLLAAVTEAVIKLEETDGPLD